MKTKESLVETLESELRDIQFEHEKLRNEEQKITEQVSRIEKEQQAANDKSEFEKLKHESLIKTLEEARENTKFDCENSESMINNSIKIKETQLDTLNQQYERLIEEKKALEAFHKEQQSHCLNFFLEAIKPLELV